jgi:hypothetical protein
MTLVVIVTIYHHIMLCKVIQWKPTGLHRKWFCWEEEGLGAFGPRTGIKFLLAPGPYGGLTHDKEGLHMK